MGRVQRDGGEFHIYEWSVLNKERSQRTYTALSE